MFDLLLIDLVVFSIGFGVGLLTRWPWRKTLIVAGLLGAVPAAAYAVISFPDAAAVPREFAVFLVLAVFWASAFALVGASIAVGLRRLWRRFM
ncbi:MAG: hypothetical protein PSV23_10250 [Brevundimonas sp.]|uniref:hypothetical protein n=1 Tax=Brevundimonas sp. TaxID=1871086 RepID=UPI002489314D|nr:hypothetical protein [Brevundimonas sp.]MDI1327165.1 hypothetical protein [Brevundimonas sp.]